MLLMIVGSGRSGTSVLAGAMQRLGFRVPEPEVKADESNPRGFGEPQWVVDFHNDLLPRLGVQVSDARPSAWTRAAEAAYRLEPRRMLRDWLAGEFAISPRVVVKDPRTLWFIPLWTAAAADLGVEPSFVTMLRHPAEVVASKEKWYDTVQNRSHRVAGWLNAMLYTERATRDSNRAFVVFEDLLSDWTQVISRLDDELGLDLLRTADYPRMQAVSALIEPTLHRSQQSWEDLDVPKPLVELAERAWRDLLAVSEDSTGELTLARLDTTRADYGELYDQAVAIAHSTIVAARRRLPNDAPPPLPSTRVFVRGKLGRIGRATPMGLKRFLPESIKGPLRQRLR